MCVPLVLYADAFYCSLHDHVKFVTYLFTKRITQIKMLFLCTLWAYRGSRSVALLIFNLGTNWKCVANFTPRLFSPGKNPGIHSVGGWVAPRRGLEGSGEEKNLFLLSGF